MRINAISRTPANPPPTNATNSHHNETICYPRFLWFREIAKDLHLGRATDSSNELVRPVSLSLHLSMSEKNPAFRRTVFTCLGTPPERHKSQLHLSLRANRRHSGSGFLRTR